jgi:outer membrane protein OmpA-like peptidoglycan-associated protein
MALRRPAAAVLLAAFCAACSSTGEMTDSNANKGALLGGGHEHRAGGVLIGATTGALAGGLAGKYLDQQAAELDAIPGADVQRRDDSLLINFSDAILFSTGKSALMPGAYDRLRAVATTLNNYPESLVIVKGHTDAVGEDALNQRLSEERSDRVRNLLIAEGVSPSRVTAIGFGESMPVTTNASAEGRAQNRRVEIEIRPHDDVIHGT